MIRKVQIEDAKQLLEIYNYYVENSIVTFDIEPLSLHGFIEKMVSINEVYPFLIYEENGEILGYAYGSRWRPKLAYKHTVESTVYVKHSVHGKQIGTQLYTELLRLFKEQKFHLVLGALTLPNEASIKLHEKFGFRQVTHFNEVGFKFNTWHDVGFWQIKL